MDAREDPAAGATVADTLDAILEQVRRLFDPSGCAFVIIQREPRRIEPAAAWFSSPDVAGAMNAMLRRPYEARRPGLTEAAVERGEPLVVTDLDRWAGAAAIRERLRERLDRDAADTAWHWYRGSQLVACPVRTASGRVLGVLTIAVGRERPLGEDEIRSVEAMAALAALAIERSELLAREAARAREELLLKEAAREMPASLEIEAVHRAVVEHAGRLAPSAAVALAALEPAGDSLRVVAVGSAASLTVGAVDALHPDRRGDALARGRTERDGDRFHVPIALGRRSFGVLTAEPLADAPVASDDVRRLEALAPLAAAAIANAADFSQERRVARALARGFVPFGPPELDGLELGLVYDPAELAGGGGDFFGVWPLRHGGTAVLVGDVAGKGLEVSAISAMTRFFVEARTWDCPGPARVLAEVNALLCARGPRLGFATAFLGMLAEDRLRFANAGHVPPLVRRSDGAVDELRASGMPLAVEAGARWDDDEVPMRAGDLLFAATDGLVEARRDGVVLGEARVRSLVASEGGRLTPQELVDRAHAAALEWAGRVSDDIVIVAVRRR